MGVPGIVGSCIGLGRTGAGIGLGRCLGRTGAGTGFSRAGCGAAGGFPVVRNVAGGVTAVRRRSRHAPVVPLLVDGPEA
ncbi:hypothetical protein D9M72_507940 [compost metagenome]|jgi:hypothetical protein